MGAEQSRGNPIVVTLAALVFAQAGVACAAMGWWEAIHFDPERSIFTRGMQAVTTGWQLVAVGTLVPAISLPIAIGVLRPKEALALSKLDRALFFIAFAGFAAFGAAALYAAPQAFAIIGE